MKNFSWLGVKQEGQNLEDKATSEMEKAFEDVRAYLQRFLNPEQLSGFEDKMNKVFSKFQELHSTKSVAYGDGFTLNRDAQGMKLKTPVVEREVDLVTKGEMVLKELAEKRESDEAFSRVLHRDIFGRKIEKSA